MSEKAVPFKEGRELNDLFNLGFILELPITIPIMLLTLLKIQSMEGHIGFNIKMVFIVAAAFLANYILKFIHEYIHAVLYPAKSEKTIWKYTSNGAYFVYCSTKISKLGIILFVIWLFIADKIDLTISIVYVILTWMTTFFAMGDLANAYNTIRQIPENAKVFNHGLHSYWINE